jgi:RimJ/RimL family protein N-acetyltransferase
MAGVIRSPEHETRRSWTVYITGALEPSQCTGIITLRPSNDRPNEYSVLENRWQLGYLFRPQYWGNGYATESCLAAIDSLRKELEGFPAQERAILVAYIDPGNDESMKVLKKLGFKVVGHRKLDGPDRFLAGQWRTAENLILKRDL